MSNLLDYLDWRGDLSLESSPFNEVDNLLFAELSFLDLAGIVPDVGAGESVELCQAVSEYFRRNKGKKIHMGVLVPNEIVSMAEKMAMSCRFAHMRLNCFHSCLDTDREVQFAALTIELGDGTIYIAFRGTDDTLVGWKEDFNMAFCPIVPSQRMAVEYVQRTAALYPGCGIRIGGHSKGGNLTVYSAVCCGEEIQKRILGLYNNDGPGFKESLVGTAGYQRIRDRLVTIVPESSVVGMLLEHDDNYTVVRSHEQGIYQHDGFSWEVLGRSFVHVDDISAEGRNNDKAIRSFIGELDDQQRSLFVDALFEVLGSTNAQTLTELESDPMKAVSNMIKSYKELNKEARQILSRAIKVLLQVGTENLRGGLEEKGQEIKKLLKLK